MRTLLTFSMGLSIWSVSSVGYGQSDLQKLGQFLNGLQQLQQQQNQGQFTPKPPQQGGGNRQYKYSDPNSSGNQNQGDFGRQDFFQPGGGRPNSSRPGQTYPGNVIYPNGSYPNGSYPNGTYPNNTYPNGSYNANRPGYTVPSRTGSSRYPDPPVAPARKHSGLPIRISCSSTAVGTCQYELKTASGSKFPYTISAGKSQTLSDTTSWVFRYRPTSTSQWQEYRLRGGRNYVIQKVSNQWQLYMVP